MANALDIFRRWTRRAVEGAAADQPKHLVGHQGSAAFLNDLGKLPTDSTMQSYIQDISTGRFYSMADASPADGGDPAQ